MKNSPLQLEHSVIEEIVLKPARGTQEFCENLNIASIPTFSRADKDPTRWLVGLEISFSGEGEKPTPYSGMIRVGGWFRTVTEGMTEEKLLKLVAVNAPTILYSTAREVIAGLTARGVNGLLLLPSVSFVDNRIAVEKNTSGATASATN